MKLRDLPLDEIFSETQKVYDEFVREEMPPQCYGWRSWKMEKIIERLCPDLKYIGGIKNVEGDFIHTDGTVYESKCVQDAFKLHKGSIKIPPITITNFRGWSYEKEFANMVLLVWDIPRRCVGMFPPDAVQRHLKRTDSTTSTQLTIEEAIDYVSLNDLFSL
tara:strand:+ start:45 stop:530 length:486 start_codon:yes stop_codon:yes gene_type:complete